jgi:serine/threonine protein phosphatase PrpC
LQDILHGAIYGHPSYYTDLELAIEETCVAVDKEFLGICKEKRQYCGTTALGAFIRGHQLLVFNIGDCQAVLCSNGVAVSACLLL